MPSHRAPTVGWHSCCNWCRVRRMGLSLPEVTVSIFSVSSPSAGTLISKSVRFALLGGLAAFSLFGATGCYARVRAHPTVVATYQEPVYEEPVVYVQSAPV